MVHWHERYPGVEKKGGEEWGVGGDRGVNRVVISSSTLCILESMSEVHPVMHDNTRHTTTHEGLRGVCGRHEGHNGGWGFAPCSLGVDGCSHPVLVVDCSRSALLTAASVSAVEEHSQVTSRAGQAIEELGAQLRGGVSM